MKKPRSASLVLALVLVCAASVVLLGWILGGRRLAAPTPPPGPHVEPRRSEARAAPSGPGLEEGAGTAAAREEVEVDSGTESPSGPRLHVVDSITARELPGARAFSLRAAAPPRTPFAPNERDLGETVSFDSPVAISVLEGVDRWWITSPGHGWALLTLSTRTRDHEIRLRPTGRVRFAIEGLRLTGREVLRAEGGEGEAPYELGPLEKPEGVWRKLLPGERELSVVRRPRRSRSRVLATAAVTVRAGREVAVRLSVDDPRPTRSVSVSGFVFSAAGDEDVIRSVEEVVIHELRAEADEPVPRVTLRPGEDLLVRAREGFAEWEPIDMYPGRYEVEVDPLSLRVPVTVPETSRFTVDVELPARVERRLRFVDAATGEAASPFLLIYCSRVADGLDRRTAFSFAGRSLRVSDAVAEVSVPPDSTLYLRILGDPYGFQSHEIPVTDEDPIRVALDRARPFSLILRRDGRRFPVAESWWSELRLEPVDGAGLYMGKRLPSAGMGNLLSRGGYSEVTVFLSREGAYEVVGPGVSGVLTFDADSPAPVHLDL